MSTREKIDAIAIIFDVGKSISECNSKDGSSFWEKSKECISWILKRKIMSMSKDLICLILTGVDTDEEGESVGYYDVKCNTIHLKFDFQLASWDILEYIENNVKAKDLESDWLEALTVALRKFDSLEELYNVSSKRAVIFSKFEDTTFESLDLVLSSLQNDNVQITVIGADALSDEPYEPKTKVPCLENENQMLSGEEVVHLMLERLGDLMQLCSFDSALRQLSSYSKKTVRATPWNCILDVGDLKISVQVFKKVDCKSYFRANFKSQKPAGVEHSCQREISSQSELSDTVRDLVMHYKHIEPNSEETKDISVDKDDVIAGFRYGASMVPFSDEDKSVMSYKPGRKCLSILGFTHLDNIPYYILTGEGSYIVVPRDKDERAEVALSALVQAMSETSNVAVVRKVHSDDKGLSLGVLYPFVEESEVDGAGHKECLVLIELAFEEDVRTVRLPGLKRVERTIKAKQYDAIDNLIDEMDLMKVQSGVKNETYEALDLYSRHEVKSQFFQHCLVQKALYPDKPLPKELPDHCQKYIAQPDSFFAKSELLEKKLVEVFPISTKSEASNSSSETREERKDSEDSSVFYTFATEKERTAENCFRKLFERHKCPPPETIRDLLRLSVDKYYFRQEDVVEAFLRFTLRARQLIISSFSDEYNYWMRRMRIYLGMDGELERSYWKGVLEGHLGLITSEEHSESSATKEEAQFFLDSLKVQKENEDDKRRQAAEEEEAINALF